MTLRGTVYVIAKGPEETIARHVIELDAANADDFARLAAITIPETRERLEFGPIGPPWHRMIE